MKSSSAENKNWNWSQGNREHKYTGLQLIYTSNNQFLWKWSGWCHWVFGNCTWPRNDEDVQDWQNSTPKEIWRGSSHQLPSKNLSFPTLIWKTRLHSRGKWLLPFSTDATGHFHWWQELQGVSEDRMQHTTKNLVSLSCYIIESITSSAYIAYMHIMHTFRLN